MIGTGSHPAELRGVVLTTGAADLLLPFVAMAEVVGYQDPTPYASAPPWLLGAVTWRGCAVPLLSLAMADAEPVDVDRGQRARLVICYTPSGNRALPYVGILSFKPPRLARLSPQVLEPTQTPSENPFVLHGLTFAERPAWIPDMDSIERAVLGTIRS